MSTIPNRPGEQSAASVDAEGHKRVDVIRCACLVAARDSRILLVRVRQNEHWYLPGGKIEPDEQPADALVRELKEELGIAVQPQTVRFLYTVRGPAYGQAGDVELICFEAKWINEPRALGEITAVAWLDLRELHKFAPAVRLLCESFLRPAAPIGS